MPIEEYPKVGTLLREALLPLIYSPMETKLTPDKGTKIINRRCRHRELVDRILVHHVAVEIKSKKSRVKVLILFHMLFYIKKICYVEIPRLLHVL